MVQRDPSFGWTAGGWAEAPLPSFEEARLTVLDDLNILYSDKEEIFDGITRVAAELARAPIAILSLVTRDKQWFKSQYGLGDVCETPRDQAFSAHAIRTEGMFEVQDTLKDSRFRTNPLVTGDPRIRYYLGFPLSVGHPERFNIGTLCVIDRRPRVLTPATKEGLACLADLVSGELQSRLSVRALDDASARIIAGQAELERERAKHAGILGSASVGLWEWNLQTDETVISPGWAASLGYTLAELSPFTTDRFRALCHEDDVGLLTAAAEAHASGQSSKLDVELRLRHAQGHWVWSNIRGALATRTGDGAPEWLVGAQINVHRVRSEQEVLKERGAELEAAVEARTHDMAEALKRAESADQAKLAFLATLSHELNTPLNGVLGLTQMLRQSTLDAQQTKLTDFLLESGTQLQRMIGRLLSYSRDASDAISLVEEPVDPADLITRAEQLVASMLAGKAVTLRHDIDELPSGLLADDTKLFAVLSNLVVNAVKFTDEGHIVIRCRRLDGGDSRETLRFEVEDSGPGFNADDAEMLFQPFRQAGEVTTRRKDGVGLGLAIAKRNIEAMGGRIGAESTPGKGSLFWFEVSLRVVTTD